MNRKTKLIILVVIVILLVSFVAFAGAKKAAAKETTTLCSAIKFLETSYHQHWINGGREFANSVGLGDHYVIQACGTSSEKQINDIKALIAKTGGNVVFCIDPNQASDSLAIAKILEEAGVYFVTWWNKPPDVNVMDYSYWVCHISFNSIEDSYRTSIALFKSLPTPYKGEIIALQGQLANTVAINRFAGLQKALKEYPEVKLVGQGDCEWAEDKAFDMTSNMLIAHPDIVGIWTAGDAMAVGAIEALRKRGLAGKVKVCGNSFYEPMIEAIRKGEAVATAYQDPYWQGGIGLALALAAKEGKLDVSSLPKNKRQWLAESVFVDANNVDDFSKNYIENVSSYDWTDLFGHWSGAMK